MVLKCLAEPDLSQFDRISSHPGFTNSFSYVSPREAETRFTRATKGDRHDEPDSYKAFLERYFADSTANRPDYGAERSEQLRLGHDDAERIDGNSREYEDNYNDSEYERIKALSKQQEKEIKKNPKHCKVVIKDGMQCNVCKDPQTGSHSQSCSFSSTPPAKKYAYVKERNYNSKDQDKEKDEEEGDDDEENGEGDYDEEDEKRVEASNTNEKKVRSRGPPMTKQKNFTPTTTSKPQRSQSIRSAVTTTKATPVRPRFHATYKRGNTISTTTSSPETRPKRRVIGLDPFLYGSHSSDERNDKKKRNTRRNDDDDDDSSSSSAKHGSYDDYFAHIFPEAKNGRLQIADSSENQNADDDVEYHPDYESKQNVEKVLAEFKTKDWSKCAKEIRGDLTCYLCRDDSGVRHEECMFVSGSGAKDAAPKSSRLAYSETKEFHTPNNGPAEKYTAAEKDEHYVPKKAGKPKKKNSRKLIVRKRKTRVSKPHGEEASLNPLDIDEHQSAGSKKTIKRMVSIKMHTDEEPKSAATDGRSMTYEHSIEHVSE